MAFSPGAAQGREPSSSFADDRSWAVDENGEPIPDISGGVALAGEAGRGLGLGVRNVLEGFGSLTDTLLNRPVDVFGNMLGRDVGLTNPGKARADVMGLPEAETDMERNIASVSQGAVADIPLMLTGAGMAKMALTPVMRGVGRALVASPVADTVLEGYWAFLTEARLECAGRGGCSGRAGASPQEAARRGTSLGRAMREGRVALFSCPAFFPLRRGRGPHAGPPPFSLFRAAHVSSRGAPLQKLQNPYS